MTSRFLLPAALLAAVAACSDSTPAPAGKPTCEAIFERCHPLDTGSGDIHECHEFAEAAATTEAQCVARRASCFTACTASDAGADAATDVSSDAPASDAATDGAAADGAAHDH